MKKNMGNADRFIRAIIAAIFGYLYFSGLVTGTAGIILLVVGGIFLLTSVVGNCPLYSVLGVKTCRVQSKER